MKRSEMEEIINRALGSDLMEYPRETIAANILATIEDAGMLPPPHRTKGFNTEELSPIGSIIYGRALLNEWEEE